MTEKASPKYKLMNFNSPYLYHSIPIPQCKHTTYLSLLFSDSFGPVKVPGQAAEVGLCEPHEVQHGQVQGPTPGPG